MAILFYASSLPGERIHLPPFPYSDKAVHFAAYSALGALIAWRKRLRGMSAVPDRSSHAARDSRDLREMRDFRGIAVGMLYAVSDEIHQIYVPERTFDFLDLGADVLGVAAGLWAYRKLTSLLE